MPPAMEYRPSGRVLQKNLGDCCRHFGALQLPTRCGWARLPPRRKDDDRRLRVIRFDEVRMKTLFDRERFWRRFVAVGVMGLAVHSSPECRILPVSVAAGETG